MQNHVPTLQRASGLHGSKKNPPLRADGIIGPVGREKTEHLNYFVANVSAREESFRPKRVKQTQLREN